MLILKFLSYFVLNYLVIFMSKDIDLDQFKNDLDYIGFSTLISNEVSIILVCFLVSLLNSIIIRIFRPLMELYILHYFKFSFYLLINLLSISSIYIVLRIYGYSRLYLAIYIFLVSTIQIISEKIEN